MREIGKTLSGGFRQRERERGPTTRSGGFRRLFARGSKGKRERERERERERPVREWWRCVNRGRMGEVNVVKPETTSQTFNFF